MDKFNTKVLQKDIKSLLNERKLLHQKANVIVSPIAKYNSSGTINCIICRTAIKSASLWRVHVSSKLHKNNVKETKLLNKKLLENSLLAQSKSNTLKNEMPDISKCKSSFPIVENITYLNSSNEFVSNNVDKNILTTNALEVLPEMFFDDPVVDAKIRNADYKDAQEDEWVKFQREIKEESVASNMIIAGEQKNSAVEREIIEINEQIHHWSKVLGLEEKAEQLHKTVKRSEDSQIKDTYNDSSEEEMFNEYLDWRSKSCI